MHSLRMSGITKRMSVYEEGKSTDLRQKLLNDQPGEEWLTTAGFSNMEVISKLIKKICWSTGA